MRFSRRAFIHRGTAGLVATQLPLLFSRTARAGVGFGPLKADPNGILDLPEGFSYVVLETAGDTMSDGYAMGGSPDGMACFWNADRSQYLLMRNHEVDVGASVDVDLAYNPNRCGGVSRLVIDPQSLERVSSNWVLTGTSRNCAGGPSPWGWLSCEETEESGHGYVFLCDPYAEQVQAPQRAASLGRFKHEAAAVEPDSNIIYLTEDKGQGALYRHVPWDAAKPFDGRLQAMRVVGQQNFDTSSDLSVGASFEVEWINLSDPTAKESPTAIQALDAGAAIVNRGEGIWYGEGSFFFAATEGGPVAGGQIFRLDPAPEGGTLTLVAQEEGDGHFFNPDNVTVAPWGDLVIAEDNTGPNHLQGMTPEGDVYEIARNAYESGVSEFCGVCFSPDGRVLFVNMQEPGFTLAITGPFPQRGGSDSSGC